MNFAPMLAVLFIGARMRALQMDPVNGAPQKWAQNCFFMCTYAVLAQTCLCIAIPIVLGGKAKKGKVEGDMEYEVNNAVPGIVMTIIRFCITISIYVGFTCVIYSIFTIQHPQGPPQGWVQDGMYMATWALLIQFLMVLAVGIASGGRVECDEDGTPKWEPSNKFLVWVALALKWPTFIFLYGGVITVIVGVYTMTPETANGRGSVPLVGDGKVPLVDVKVPGYSGLPEPVGANDIPYVAPEQGKGPTTDTAGSVGF